MIRNHVTGQFVKGKNTGSNNSMWRPVLDRFWEKVDKNYQCTCEYCLSHKEHCHFWLGAKTHGYGTFKISSEKSVKAYRFAYELVHGPIPNELDLHHLCQNPPCVNPAHLEPLTRKVHIHKGESFAAKEARQTHCLRGHPLSGANLGIFKRKKQGRFCKTCKLYNEKFRKRRTRYELNYHSEPPKTSYFYPDIV